MSNKDLTNFKVERIKNLKQIYSDEASSRRGQDRSFSYSTAQLSTAAQVRAALENAVTNRDDVVAASQKLYAINPIYSSLIEYLSNMFLWRYKVIPHKVYSKSKAQLRKQIKDEDFQLMYNLMLEAADGLSIESKFPSLLTLLFTNGAVYLTTVSDEDSLTVDSILLPDKYCRKVAETQYGTAIIEFDYSYFQTLGLTDKELNDYFKMFPKEFKSAYNRYLRDSSNMRWQTLDPRFSTGVLLNEVAIPTFFYLYGSILDYEKYQDNELERNSNLLKYLVVHTMPLYQDQLIFDVDEVAAVHKSLAKIVNTNDKARLITTYGDVKVEKITENDTSENQVLSKAYKAIFNNGGFNSSLFTGESVEALNKSLIRDKGMVWKYVKQLISFYSIAINNWFDFKTFEANLDILPISPYTYSDDIKIYKENATLGVGKLDYFIASGIRQKNIQDQLNLENFLGLNSITPMQTSYTQTAEDRIEDEHEDNNDTNQTTTKDNNSTSPSEENGEPNSKTGIEPPVEEDQSSTPENVDDEEK